MEVKRTLCNWPGGRSSGGRGAAGSLSRSDRAPFERSRLPGQSEVPPKLPGASLQLPSTSLPSLAEMSGRVATGGRGVGTVMPLPDQSRLSFAAPTPGKTRSFPPSARGATSVQIMNVTLSYASADDTRHSRLICG